MRGEGVLRVGNNNYETGFTPHVAEGETKK